MIRGRVIFLGEKMKKVLKFILIVFFYLGLSLIFYISLLYFVTFSFLSSLETQRAQKSDFEILENSENITQTVIFENNTDPVFRARYKNIDRLYYSGWINDEKMWKNLQKLDDENVSDIVLLNKVIDSEIAYEKYQIVSDVERLICFSKSDAYYGYRYNIGLWGSKFFYVFEIDEDDLVDLYIDEEENIARVTPDYEVLNYGTIKSISSLSADYDFFYFVSSHAIYIYNGETAELHEIIETESDIYGVSYGFSYDGNISGYKLLVAVKDEKQFKVMEYIIE